MPGVRDVTGGFLDGVLVSDRSAAGGEGCHDDEGSGGPEIAQSEKAYSERATSDKAIRCAHNEFDSVTARQIQ
jgi:hypothetical protein